MYAKGLGVGQDDAEAVIWFRKAAEQGHAQAQYNLGWMYANGQGVAQDHAEPAIWYRKAAEQGMPKPALLCKSFRRRRAVCCPVYLESAATDGRQPDIRRQACGRGGKTPYQIAAPIEPASALSCLVRAFVEDGKTPGAK
jgi:TPR repeat protein